ncbi:MULTISPECIES: Hsp20/alpha crystallin family protein [Haloprofundus]|uniref:Hsp20/alpha crystallin family protein n=1 Tax=Haloprofundus TaxID=1911573 RepID=UPI000E433561|nr:MULTISPECIES: Hsp20/alpha crystallin family protein [Haloprofundus]QCJ47095.1 Hsp20/alpha crystallin family protein [Haloprofundus sp. MHR1]
MPDRNNPFDEIERLFDQLSRNFESSGMSRLRDVSIDLEERDDEFVVTADLPGYETEDIDLSVRDRQLTIRAEHSDTAEERDDAYLRRERTRRSVSRTVHLPESVEEEASDASYRHGVLTVRLPKQRRSDDDEGHRIDIE